MYSTVRNYLEEATQRSWVPIRPLTTETIKQSIIWEIYKTDDNNILQSQGRYFCPQRNIQRFNYRKSWRKIRSCWNWNTNDLQVLQRIRTFFLRRRSLKEPSTNRNKRAKTNYLNGYKDQMTTIFLEIDNDSYLLEHLTYYSETKEFTVLTERVGDWEKVNFTCPEESELYSFFSKPFTSTHQQETWRV